MKKPRENRGFCHLSDSAEAFSSIAGVLDGRCRDGRCRLIAGCTVTLTPGTADWPAQEFGLLVMWDHTTVTAGRLLPSAL
jgi:hypothetical protein